MTKTPTVKIDNTCLRCGFLNTFTIKLTNSDDAQTYVCMNCNFIAFLSYVTWNDDDSNVSD